MRIAVWYNLPSGGGKRALNDHLQGLKARGHEIVAWRPPLIHEGFLPISQIVEEHVVPLDLEIGEGSGYGDNLRRHIKRQLFLRGAMRRHSQEAGRQMAEGSFDVLFANTCMHYHAPWIGRYFAGPKLLYLGEPNRPLYEAMPRLPWPALPEDVRRSWRISALKRKAKDALDLRAYRLQAADELQNAGSFDRLLVNSNYSRESILRAYGLPARVCYLGIDAARFENRGLSRDRLVLSVGAFVPAKDPEFVVRAVASLAEARPPLVWIANLVDEPYLASVASLATRLGVDLQLRRHISDSEVVEWLNSASVMAYAPRLEPFGYAPLEANACGLPAVVVAEGGVKESIRDGVNGIVVPHDHNAMAEAIARLLDDPNEARLLGESASAHVRQVWTLDRATDELERNLLEIAGKS